jgi:hypothetical protein
MIQLRRATNNNKDQIGLRSLAAGIFEILDAVSEGYGLSFLEPLTDQRASGHKERNTLAAKNRA